MSEREDLKRAARDALNRVSHDYHGRAYSAGMQKDYSTHDRLRTAAEAVAGLNDAFTRLIRIVDPEDGV